MLLCSNSNSTHKCFLNPVLRLSIKSAKKNNNEINLIKHRPVCRAPNRVRTPVKANITGTQRPKEKRVREKEKINECGAIKWGRNEISLPPRLSLSAGFTWIGRVICGRERERERKKERLMWRCKTETARGARRLAHGFTAVRDTEAQRRQLPEAHGARETAATHESGSYRHFSASAVLWVTLRFCWCMGDQKSEDKRFENFA